MIPSILALSLRSPQPASGSPLANLSSPDYGTRITRRDPTACACRGESVGVSKRVILCFDGEWDPPPDSGVWGSPARTLTQHSASGSVSPPATNVLRLYQSILPKTVDGRVQQKWYDPGTEMPWYHRFRDGSFGYGLDRTILQAYAYLAATYEPADELFIYGFSRGAYTARSLLGLLTSAGLPLPTLLHGDHLRLVREAAATLSLASDAPDQLREGLTRMVLDPANHLIGEAYQTYRTLQSDPQTSKLAIGRRRGTQDIAVTLLGLWDTVGPLGIPTNALRWLNEHRYNFRDTELSPIVQQAYHALAIDEHRADHNATLWTAPAKAGQTIEQRWFAGAHGDLGGTYPDRELADVSLSWILRHSMRKGLALDPSGLPEKPNALSPMHDSFSECFVGFRKWIHSRFYRPVMQTGTTTEVLDESVHTRLLHTPSYRPKNEGLTSLLTFR